MATSTSTSTQEPSLRKRMRVLERTQSLTSLKSLGTMDSKTIPLPDIKLKHKDNGDNAPASPSTDHDYESHSHSSRNSSEDEEEQRHREDEARHRKNHDKPARPTLDTKDVHGHHHRHDHYRHSSDDHDEPMSPKSRAWYEFDLAVVVALVSPIGNWLTGGDHVKNLLLIVLLIFYLHQVIEIPWSLYQKCRPRKRAHHLPPSGALAEETSIEARYARLAASELQKFEFLFLFLTFLSPFLGAALLRYATDAILGPDAVSWFSTGLFVLATGMRPWLHLVDRLSERTAELHDFVHYPPASQSVSVVQHELLESRIAELEKSFGRIKSKMASATDEVYEYVDDAVDAVEHAIRKQERKWDKYEGKVKEVEQAVVQLSSKTSHSDEAFQSGLLSDLEHMKSCAGYIIERIVPNWILTAPQKASAYYFSFPDKPSSNVLIGTPIKTRKLQNRSPSASLSPSPCITPLETIVEEEATSIYKQPPTTMSLFARPYNFTSGLVYRTGYILTAPLRAVIRMVLRNY